MARLIKWAPLAFSLTLVLSAVIANAEEYPSRTIRLVVPWPPGGIVDTLARVVGDRMSQELGQPLVVENRPGAGSKLGTDSVAKSAPDGYTLLVATSAHSINAGLYASQPYDPVQDFMPIVLAATAPSILVVSRSTPAQNLKELIELAIRRPGQLTYASAGNGSPAHLLGEMFKQATKTDLLHVPYRGAPQAMNDLLAGRINLLFANMTVGLPQVEAGQVRAIGTTSAERLPALPNLPTISEAGLPGFQGDQWLGFLAPKGTPSEIVSKLNTVVNKVLGSPGPQEMLSVQGLYVVGGSPEEFSKLIKDDIERWKRVIAESGIKVE